MDLRHCVCVCVRWCARALSVYCSRWPMGHSYRRASWAKRALQQWFYHLRAVDFVPNCASPPPPPPPPPFFLGAQRSIFSALLLPYFLLRNRRWVVRWQRRCFFLQHLYAGSNTSLCCFCLNHWTVSDEQTKDPRKDDARLPPKSGLEPAALSSTDPVPSLPGVRGGLTPHASPRLESQDCHEDSFFPPKHPPPPPLFFSFFFSSLYWLCILFSFFPQKRFICWERLVCMALVSSESTACVFLLLFFCFVGKLFLFILKCPSLVLIMERNGQRYQPVVALSPFLTGRMFVRPNILRTLRRTMIRFLIELLVRRMWLGQSKLYSILNWLVVRSKLRPEVAADSMIENVG